MSEKPETNDEAAEADAAAQAGPKQENLAPVQSGEAAPQPAAVEVNQATVLQRIRSLGASKGQLVAERDEATARADQAHALNQALRAQVAELRTENELLCEERAAVRGALEASEAQQVSTQEAAAEMVSEIGFPLEALPDLSEMAAENVLEQYEAMADTDPQKHAFLVAHKLEIQKLARRAG